MARLVSVIDSETDPFKKGRIPKPFIWGYYDGSRYRQFDETEKLAEFLAETDCVCYAHNGGKFDFHYLLDYFDAFDDIKIINGRIAQCRIGRCELRDSWLIINEKLEKYKKDEIDYALMEKENRDKRHNREKIERYLKSDCVYLYELVTAFRMLYGSALTQAGASMKQWIKISGTKPPVTDYQFYWGPNGDDGFNRFYFGGRVECVESGIIDTAFSVYDINSSYPRAMLEKHPYSENYERIDGYAKNADFYTVECVSLGAFPFRNNVNDVNSDIGLSFPNDTKRRVYNITHWELDAGLATKTVRNVRYIASIRFMKHIDFSVYINHFWNIRKRAQEKKDILKSLMAKLMMNSLYGKFAANPENYLNYMLVPDEYIPSLGVGVPLRGQKIQTLDTATSVKKWEFGGQLGPWGLAQRELDDFQKRYYNVATGASITGNARARLWLAMCSCERVLYVDTDAIACKSAGKAVTLGSDLGQWKLEGDFDKAGISGKKLYIFRGVPTSEGRHYKTASKGARLTNAELWKIAKGGEVLYERDVPNYSVFKPLDWDNPENSFLKRNIKKTAKG